MLPNRHLGILLRPVKIRIDWFMLRLDLRLKLFKERLLRWRLRPNRIQHAIMQGLQTLLGQGAFKMRDARVLNRGEDPPNPIGQRVDVGVEFLFGFFAGETESGPAGVDGDV